MPEMAPARGGNGLIKTRRKYVTCRDALMSRAHGCAGATPVGSDRSIHAAHGLVRSLPALTNAP